MTALRTHYAEISKHFDSADGSLTVEAIARRSGIMRYRSDSGDRLELVPPDLIDARDESGRPIMGMLAGAPNTNEHPVQVIRYSTDSRKAVQVGKVNEEIHIYSDADGERSVKVRFDVSDPETIADIRNGRKTGVSLGYLCNVVPEIGEYRGQPYTHRQAMPFSIDHLAIVANPRNPGAIITRFDSDDVAWLSDESKPDSPSMPIVRVDACCAACSGSKDPDESDDEPRIKKKKVKTDADEYLSMIPVTFVDQVHELTQDQTQALWMDGTIDLIRMDGRDYFVSADIAQGFAVEGLIREDAVGTCGRGWLGSKGNCTRSRKERNIFSRAIGSLKRREASKLSEEAKDQEDFIRYQHKEYGEKLPERSEIRRMAQKSAKEAILIRRVAKTAGAGLVAYKAYKAIKPLLNQARDSRVERGTGATNRSPRPGFRTVTLDSAACGRGWKGTKGNCKRTVPNEIGSGIKSAGRSIGRGLRSGGGKIVRFAKSETGQKIAATAVQVGTIAAVNHFRGRSVKRRKEWNDWQKGGGPRPGYKTIYEDD